MTEEMQEEKQELREPSKDEQSAIYAALEYLNLDWLMPYNLFKITPEIPIAAFARDSRDRDWLLLNPKVFEFSEVALALIILHEFIHYCNLGAEFQAFQGLAGDITLDIGVEILIATLFFDKWKHSESEYPRFAILQSTQGPEVLLTAINPYRLTYPPICEQKAALNTSQGESLDPVLTEIRETAWAKGIYEPYDIYGKLTYFLLEHQPPAIEIPIIIIGDMKVLGRGGSDEEGEEIKAVVLRSGEGEEQEGEEDGKGSSSGFEPSPVIEEAIEDALEALGRPGVGRVAIILPSRIRRNLKRKINLKRARREMYRMPGYSTSVVNALQGVLGREIPAPSKLQPYLVRPDRVTQNMMAAGLIPDIIPLFRNIEPRRSKDLIFYFDFSGTMSSFYESMVLFTRAMRQFMPTRLKVFGSRLQEVGLGEFIKEPDFGRWGDLAGSGRTNFEKPLRDFITQAPGTTGIMLTDGMVNDGDYSAQFFQMMARALKNRGQRMYAFIAAGRSRAYHGGTDKPRLPVEHYRVVLTDWFLIFAPIGPDYYDEEVGGLPDW